MRMSSSEFRDKISVRPSLGESATGPRYGSLRSEKCRVWTTSKRVRGKNEEEVEISSEAIFPDTSKISQGDEATINSVTHRVVSVEQVKINGRVHHIEVLLSSVGG